MLVMTEKLERLPNEVEFYQKNLDDWQQSRIDNLKLLKNANGIIARLSPDSPARKHWEKTRDDALTALEMAKINIEHFQSLILNYRNS